MAQLVQESVGEPKSVESPPSRHPIASVFFAHSSATAAEEVVMADLSSTQLSLNHPLGMCLVHGMGLFGTEPLYYS